MNKILNTKLLSIIFLGFAYGSTIESCPFGKIDLRPTTTICANQETCYYPHAEYKPIEQENQTKKQEGK